MMRDPRQASVERGSCQRRNKAPKGPLEAPSKVWKSCKGRAERQYHAHFDCPRAEVVANKAAPFNTVARIESTVLRLNFEWNVFDVLLLKCSRIAKIAIRHAIDSAKDRYSSIQES